VNQGRSVFSQLMDFIPKYEFDKAVNKYNGNYKAQGFSCWQQYVVMCFAQLTYREGLRDIEACLKAVRNKLYHCGIRSKVPKSTLAYWNETRDWQIFAEFTSVLIDKARRLYKNENEVLSEIEGLVYALDSTTMDLCLSLFPWAKFRKTKAAIKAHTLLDLRGSIPTWISISEGNVHDVNLLDDLMVEPGSYYVMDRGYVDYARLYRLHQCAAFFVTRAKDNFSCKRLYSAKVDKATTVRCDQTIVLCGHYAAKDYPDKLRRIKYYDATTNATFIFLTNNFTLPAILIAQLYKERWKVELFFKWLKQHLRIKAFYGTSRNAVYAQIWIAVSVYLLVAIMKKELKIEQSLYTILQILSVTLFEKMPIQQAFQQIESQDYDDSEANQLKMF
jgi:hypothetical protein